jgi:hypothetical protein
VSLHKFSRFRLSIAPLLPLSLLAACVPYRPAHVDAPSTLAAVEAPPKGPLSFDDAVRWAVEHNPDLLALRARAAAVNVLPAKEPIGLEASRDADRRPETMLTFDVLSLLGIGPQGAKEALARARRSEAFIAHHERAREVAGEIAEDFAIERVLRALPAIDAAPDPKAFVASGLEVTAATRIADAVGAARAAEVAGRDAEQVSTRAALARSLGAKPESAPTIVLPEAAWPPLDERVDPAALLASRAELQRKLAAYEVADGELAAAVAAQWPGLELAPGLAADPTAVFGAVRLRLPVGADREVVAMESSREAARQDVAAAVLDALADAASSRAAWTAAERREHAVRERLAASGDLLRAAQARLETGTGSALELVMATRDAIESSGELRMAAVDAARARVKAARAAGWPSAAAGSNPEGVR